MSRYEEIVEDWFYDIDCDVKKVALEAQSILCSVENGEDKAEALHRLFVLFSVLRDSAKKSDDKEGESVIDFKDIGDDIFKLTPKKTPFYY
jgi:hypothetical protein